MTILESLYKRIEKAIEYLENAGTENEETYDFVRRNEKINKLNRVQSYEKEVNWWDNYIKGLQNKRNELTKEQKEAKSLDIERKIQEHKNYISTDINKARKHLKELNNKLIDAMNEAENIINELQTE